MGGPAYINGEEYTEFDNFYIAPFEVGGRTYPSVENAFQAAKNDNDEYKNKIQAASPGGAWRLGQTVYLREDWEDIKAGVMKELVGRKLIQHPRLAKILIRTFGPIEFKGSTKYWNKTNAEILEYARNFLFTHRERLGL